jgi:hypothetical protein
LQESQKIRIFAALSINNFDMENLVQKSVKMDARVEARIKEIVKNKRYWKFNAVVNQLLMVAVDGIDPADLYEVLRYSPHYKSKKPKITIEWIEP